MQKFVVSWLALIAASSCTTTEPPVALDRTSLAFRVSPTQPAMMNPSPAPPAPRVPGAQLTEERGVTSGTVSQEMLLLEWTEDAQRSETPVGQYDDVRYLKVKP